MATKPAAGTYTVNTGHAKCPDHLYMFDEGSGTSVADQGKTGGLALTLTNTPTWGTADLGSLGGANSGILTFDSASSEYGRTAASFSVNDDGSIFICAIFKTTNASIPGASQAIVAVANSANNTDFAILRDVATTGYLTMVYDDSVVAASAQHSGVDMNDQAWHIGMGFCYHNGTDPAANMRIRVAHDGGTRETSSGSTGADVIQNLNRIAVCSNAGSSTGAHFNGSLAAVFIYKNATTPDTDWNQAFMDSLAADPWQFLNTAAPSWTATPSVSSQTATVYTVGFTSDSAATIYGVAVVAGSTAPSIAQVKAGQNGSGGAAAAANDKAVGLTADTLTLDMGGSPSPTYDLYFVLTNAVGDSTRQSIIGAPIGTIAFTVAASVTSQTTTAYTVGFTPSAACTVYGVAVVAGSTAPSVAQVKAGQNGSGGAAKANNSKAVTGADSFTLTPSDSPAFPRYDLYVVLSNGGGDSAVSNLISEYLDAPAGKSFATLTSLDATSPFYGTGTASSDTVVLDSVTDPDSYVVTCAVDGTVSYASSGDDSRQLVAADVYDYSGAAYLGAGTLVFNNLAPAPDGLAFDDVLLYRKDAAITPITLTDYAPDPEADTVTVTALDALPTGLSIASSELSGTPTAYETTNTQLQWEDEYGSTYTETVTIQVGELVPDATHVSEGVARGRIQAVASFTTTTSYTADAYVAIGDVISTDPVAGTLVPYDQVVALLVSSGSQAVGTGGSGFPVGWQGKRKKLTLKQQPNKHLKKMLDDVGKKVLAKSGKKKPLKVKPIKLWQ